MMTEKFTTGMVRPSKFTFTNVNGITYHPVTSPFGKDHVRLSLLW